MQLHFLTYLTFVISSTNAFHQQSSSVSSWMRVVGNSFTTTTTTTTTTTAIASTRSPKTVSATGDYFSHLGPTTGLPDFSKMKVTDIPLSTTTTATTTTMDTTTTTSTMDTSNNNNNISHKQRLRAFVDEAKAISLWNFPYTPDQLVSMAKHFYGPDVLIGLADDGDCLADDFEFCGSGFGPVGKDAYLTTLTAFGLDKCFETVGNMYGFYADPLQPGRVWYFNRSRAMQSGRFLGTEPNGKEIQFPPQIEYIDFNTSGKVKEHGFYTIDRRQGNTGGLGGVYGYMYAVGKSPPFPEARPYRPSFRHRVFNFFVHSASSLKGSKKKKESTIKNVNGEHVNGAAAEVNGHVNGAVAEVNGHVNGHANGHVNGHVNGSA